MNALSMPSSLNLNANSYMPQMTIPQMTMPQQTAMPEVCSNGQANFDSYNAPQMWGGEQAPELGNVFGNFQNDQTAFSAAQPSPQDNPTNQRVKGQYMEGYERAGALRNQAASEAQQMGPGTHQMPNGQDVTVSDPSSSGKVTVSQTNPNGGSSSTTYNTNDPSYVNSTHVGANGSVHQIEREGNNLKMSHNGGGIFDSTQTTKFSLQGQGDGIGIERSSDNGRCREVANADGSSSQTFNPGFFGSPITNNEPPAEVGYNQEGYGQQGYGQESYGQPYGYGDSVGVQPLQPQPQLNPVGFPAY